jgi:hypothetical protein
MELTSGPSVEPVSDVIGEGCFPTSIVARDVIEGNVVGRTSSEEVISAATSPQQQPEA